MHSKYTQHDDKISCPHRRILERQNDRLKQSRHHGDGKGGRA